MAVVTGIHISNIPDDLLFYVAQESGVAIEWPEEIVRLRGLVRKYDNYNSEKMPAEVNDPNRPTPRLRRRR